jgi:hypothetical protein
MGTLVIEFPFANVLLTHTLEIVDPFANVLLMHTLEIVDPFTNVACDIHVRNCGSIY